MTEKDFQPAVDENETGKDELIQPEQVISAESDEETKIQELENKAKANYEMYLKALAEMDNLKKRTQKDHEELVHYSNASLIKKLLPILDDFDRAVLESQKNQNYDNLYQGIIMIHKKFQELLSAEGVEAVEALGREFDPQYHQPLTVEASDQGENLVIEEFQKGYIYKKRLLRPSLVKVSQ